jgi:hypothetical protein
MFAVAKKRNTGPMATSKPRSKRKQSAPKKRSPKTPAEAELIPHKIVGELIGKRLNEHGDIVGEEPMGQVAIFSAQFGRVKQMIDADIKRAREVAEAERRGLEDMDGR